MQELIDRLQLDLLNSEDPWKRTQGELSVVAESAILNERLAVLAAIARWATRNNANNLITLLCYLSQKIPPGIDIEETVRIVNNNPLLSGNALAFFEEFECGSSQMCFELRGY